MTTTHWVLVADSARARIFECDQTLDPLTERMDRIHPASRAKVSELVSGARGATAAGPGGSRSAYDRHSDPHRVEVERFAREMADLLREGLTARSYERLILIAPARFLGALRSEIDSEVARRVVAEVPRDFSMRPTHEMARLVGDAVRAQQDSGSGVVLETAPRS